MALDLFFLALAFLGVNDDKNPSERAEVLLIAPDDLSEAWKEFAHWKTRLGKPTKVVSVGVIEKLCAGKDIQQKIRSCVLAHIRSDRTRWVILGGDRVPDRDTVHPTMGYKDIPTDLYYISEGTWDADKDGVYGEWKDDRAEIAYVNPSGTSIGRIPVRSVADVRAYTDKVIAYESRYPAKDFARTLVYTNTVDQSEPKVRRSWDDYISKAWTRGTAVRFFHTETPWDKAEKGDYDLLPKTWAKLINSKSAGKMHMHGHGFLPAWVLEKDQMVDSRWVDQLTNEDAYLVMTTVSCFTGQYEGKEDPSIAETMLRKPKAGAIVIVAPTREGVPIFHQQSDYRLMVTEGKLDGTTQHHTRFWTHGLSENLTVGEAFMKAKELLAEDAKKTAGYHWCACEITLLGDPTLDLRADDPIRPEVKVTREKASVLVEAGKPNLTVCLWKTNEVYEVAKTDASGKARFELRAATPGEILLTVSGPSVNAVTKSIPVE